MLKVCLDCTAKFSKRAKISVLFLLLCIFSGWGWFEGVCAFCDPLTAGWIQQGCGNDASYPRGRQSCTGTLLWATCTTDSCLWHQVILTPLSKKGEFWLLFYTTELVADLTRGGAALTSDSSCCWKGQISGHLPSCELCTGAAALLEESAMLRNVWHNKGIICIM